MAQDFDGKKLKDIEKASETIISSLCFINSIANRINSNSTINVTRQLSVDNSIDELTDKKNRIS